MKDNKIVFGVAGAGFIGKRHIAMIDADPETLLAAVCDVRTPEACGVTNPVPFYSSISDMLAAHPEIDVVSICTPNGLHADMAIEVLMADRSVVIEKPMATSVADALRIGQAENVSRGRVFSVFQNRYTPTSVWLKDVVESGRLGSLRQIVVNCMWNRDERYYKPGHWHGTMQWDGGTLFSQFSHYMDILLWLVGPIKVVTAELDDFCHSSMTDFEDTGVVTFRTDNGAIGTFNFTTAVPMQNLESSIILIGSNGSVKVGGQYMSQVDHCQISNYTMPELAPANPPNDYGDYKGSAANHCYVIRNVAETLLHGAQPTAGYVDGLNVVRAIEEIYRYRTDDFRSKTTLFYKPC